MRGWNVKSCGSFVEEIGFVLVEVGVGFRSLGFE